MDVFDAASRSRVMSRIRGRDTQPELKVRRLLHRLGYRFRLHRRDLPGRPDMRGHRRPNLTSALLAPTLTERV